MTPGSTIEVVSLEWDRNVRRRWLCELIKAENVLIELKGEFDRDVEHPSLGLIEKGTVSAEYFWLDRPYNIFAFTRPDGNFRNWYCNVSLLPQFEGSTLSFVDLELDVLIWPGQAPLVLDRDDLEVLSKRLDTTGTMKVLAEDGLANLLQHIEFKHYPFSLLEGKP
ncbi:MAG: DUF402 domain-containing protein [Acidobacteria bacterium]|nr:DUF402 domain-containing protein [Acidobacteriota bacterium]